MTHPQEQRRKHAIARYLAGEKIDVICRDLHCSKSGLDHRVGHFRLFEVDSAARAPAPLRPKSPQTLSAASDRKSARLPSSRPAG
jgi:hypothetical protein